VDKFCGYVLASSISMALFHRERTGQGQLVQVPMLETMLQFNLFEHLWEAGIGANNGRGMGYTRMFSPHRRPYPTKDGYICVLAVNDQQWKNLMQAIGHPEILSDPKFSTMTARMRNVNLLYAMLADAIKGRTTEEWKSAFDAADVPNGPVRTLDELTSDEYLRDTGFFQQHEHPTEGSIMMTSIPQFFSRSPGTVRRLPPNLGEHGEEILLEAGYTRENAQDILNWDSDKEQFTG
jgi:formyl-CoA transferase